MVHSEEFGKKLRDSATTLSRHIEVVNKKAERNADDLQNLTECHQELEMVRGGGMGFSRSWCLVFLFGVRAIIEQRHGDLKNTLKIEAERLQELITKEAKTRFDSIQQVRDEQRQVADRLERKVSEYSTCFLIALRWLLSL